MADYILQSGELYHYGIPGMRWGIRRYQTRSGTLNRAGKKRYEREMEKAKNEARILRNRQTTVNKFKRLEELQAKNKAKKNALNGKGEPEIITDDRSKKTSSTKSNKKLMSEMSNAEIKAKIERIRLENELKSLTPQKVSAGKKFVEAIGGVAKQALTNIATDTGKAAVNKWLGLDDSDFKKLEKKSKIADFKKKIAESEMSERKNRKEQQEADSKASEAKAKAKKEADDKSRSDTYGYTSGYHHGAHTKSTVYGEGSSRYREKKGPVYDADWRDVSPESTALGQRTVAGLLEDKRKKKK